MELRHQALEIAQEAVHGMDPREGVLRALRGRSFPGEVVLLSLGKAGWTMAAAAREALGSAISRGLVVTKYGHSRGPLEGLEIIEAGQILYRMKTPFGGELGALSW